MTVYNSIAISDRTMSVDRPLFRALVTYLEYNQSYFTFETVNLSMDYYIRSELFMYDLGEILPPEYRVTCR